MACVQGEPERAASVLEAIGARSLEARMRMLAAEAFVAAGASEAVNGEAFNVGGDEHIAHRDLVAMLVELAGQGSYKFIEWPAEKKAIDIGSFYADSSLFMARTGWAPSVPLREGFTRTLNYYRAHLPHYVDQGSV